MPSEAWLDQIDRLLAEKVMGWRQLTQHYLGQFGGVLSEIWEGADGKATLYANGWHPTRDRGQALMVLERCPGMHIQHSRFNGGRDWYEVYCEDERGVIPSSLQWFEGEDAKVVIALAALKQAGVEVPSE